MIQAISEQIAAVEGAPLLYLGGVAVLGLVIWGVARFLYNHRIEGLKEEIVRFERENARLRERLDELNRHGGLAIELTSTGTSTPASGSTVTPPANPSDAASRVFVPNDVRPDTLRTIYDDRTSYEANRMMEAYVGKWLQVEGTVRNVEHDEYLGWSMALKEEGASDMTLNSILLMFSDNESEKLKMTRKGASVRVVGRISKADRHVVSLDRCTFVE